MNKTISILRLSFFSFLIFALAFAPRLTPIQKTQAQDKLDLKQLSAENEAKSLAQFAETLGQFLNAADDADKKPSVSKADLLKLENEGRRIKDGTSNLRRNLEALIAKLKAANRWNQQFDSDCLSSAKSSNVKRLLQQHGARKLLEMALNEINIVGGDVDKSLNNVRKKSASATRNDHLFAAHALRAKVRFGCILLGAGIFAAELLRADRTAENLDNIFDNKGCGGSGQATAQ